MDALLQDLRYSVRMFRKAPGFAMVAVLAVAFGIGVNSAIFTLLNGVALRPLPVRNSSEVVTVYQTIRGPSRNVHGLRSYLSYPEYKAYRDQNHVFAGLAVYALAEVTLGGHEARTVARSTGLLQLLFDADRTTHHGAGIFAGGMWGAGG